MSLSSIYSNKPLSENVSLDSAAQKKNKEENTSPNNIRTIITRPQVAGRHQHLVTSFFSNLAKPIENANIKVLNGTDNSIGYSGLISSQNTDSKRIAESVNENATSPIVALNVNQPPVNSIQGGSFPSLQTENGEVFDTIEDFNPLRSAATESNIGAFKSRLEMKVSLEVRNIKLAVEGTPERNGQIISNAEDASNRKVLVEISHSLLNVTINDHGTYDKLDQQELQQIIDKALHAITDLSPGDENWMSSFRNSKLMTTVPSFSGNLHENKEERHQLGTATITFISEQLTGLHIVGRVPLIAALKEKMKGNGAKIVGYMNVFSSLISNLASKRSLEKKFYNALKSGGGNNGSQLEISPGMLKYYPVSQDKPSLPSLTTTSHSSINNSASTRSNTDNSNSTVTAPKTGTAHQTSGSMNTGAAPKTNASNPATAPKTVTAPKAPVVAPKIVTAPKTSGSINTGAPPKTNASNPATAPKTVTAPKAPVVAPKIVTAPKTSGSINTGARFQDSRSGASTGLNTNGSKPPSLFQDSRSGASTRFNTNGKR